MSDRGIPHLMKGAWSEPVGQRWQVTSPEKRRAMAAKRLETKVTARAQAVEREMMGVKERSQQEMTDAAAALLRYDLAERIAEEHQLRMVEEQRQKGRAFLRERRATSGP